MKANLKLLASAMIPLFLMSCAIYSDHAHYGVFVHDAFYVPHHHFHGFQHHHFGHHHW